MAIVFELWAECENAESRRALLAHFSGLEHTLTSGRTICWRASEEQNPPYSPGVSVSSGDLSKYGVRSLGDALECTEAGLRLYSHLKDSPPFRFARIAWEAGNIPMRDLEDFITPHEDGACHLDLECVVDDRLFQELGQPRFCQPFREGYWWMKYRGEEYRPLWSADQPGLNDLCTELFPDYFNAQD